MFSNALMSCITMLVLSGAAMFCCSRYADLIFPFYRDLSKKVIDFLADLTARIPFALWEVLLLFLLLLFLGGLVYIIRKKKRFLSWFGWVLRIGALMIFLFVFLWGLNHYAPPISETLGLETGGGTKEELLSATRYYMQMAEHYAGLVERTDGGELAEQDFGELAAVAGKSFETLGQEYPLFRCSGAPVKKAVLTRPAFDYGGTVGMFVCFTGESTVSPNTYTASLAHTMCHEVAHRCGVAGEDEANFAAFLACTQSTDPRFLYSGYYSAFLYCYNALCEHDREAAAGLWSGETALLRADCNAANAHYEPYEGKVQEAATKVNDTYLKVFSEESGVLSYGEAADYLIAWYSQRIAG